MKILVLNAGSSSLRFRLIESNNWKCLLKGHTDGIGLPNSRIRNHDHALEIALELLQKNKTLKSLSELKAIGHRVVHGGEKYQRPTRLTPKILEDLEKLCDLAPLHNPPNLKGIRACFKLLPKIPQVAVFDTGFHGTLPEEAFLYGLPYSLYKKHQIRKYGFHGTSHAYVSEQAIKILKKERKPFQKLITCHIGNGVSVTAIRNGKSIDTSMGFTPLEGVMMGTRTGDFDPAILFHLEDNLKMKRSEIQTLVNHESGLKGLSEVSSDMRPLWAILQNPQHKSYPKVKRAYDVYAYRLAKRIASYTAALRGLDALIFTAGIGESAWYLRRDIANRLKHLGVALNSKLNQKTIEGKQGFIHTQSSRVSVLVIPTNEELKIAQEVKKIIKGH